MYLYFSHRINIVLFGNCRLALFSLLINFHSRSQHFTCRRIPGLRFVQWNPICRPFFHQILGSVSVRGIELGIEKVRSCFLCLPTLPHIGISPQVHPNARLITAVVVIYNIIIFNCHLCYL